MGDRHFREMRISRRDVLRRGGMAAVGLVVVGLIGCGDSGEPWYKDYVSESEAGTPAEETVVPP